MSPKALPTAAGTNPLHAPTLTPAQYGALHHAVRSKASRLLVDLNAKLEVELRQQHADAERINAELLAEVEGLESTTASLRNRLNRLKAQTAKYEAEMPQVVEDHAAALKAKSDRDDTLKSVATLQREATEAEKAIARVRAEVEDLNREYNEARTEERRVRRVIEQTRVRTANARKTIQANPEASRLLAMDSELADRRRRNAKRGDAPLASVTPLAG